MTDGDKRTILVTGGSRGIGRGICLAFARSGNHIYFNYSSAGEAAAQTEKLVAEAGGTATGIQVNVASEKEVYLTNDSCGTTRAEYGHSLDSDRPWQQKFRITSKSRSAAIVVAVSLVRNRVIA